MFYNTVNINVTTKNIINNIPTDSLEEELAKRKELANNDPQVAIKNEGNRSDVFDITIYPEDYNLINQDNVELSMFSDSEIIYYMNNYGYLLFDNLTNKSELNLIIQKLNDLPPWLFKDFIYDLFQLQHNATKEELFNALKDRIK